MNDNNLLELYKTTLDEEKFHLTQHQIRVSFYTGLISAILAATIAGVFESNSWSEYVTLLIGPFAIIILSFYGKSAAKRFYKRFLEAITQRVKLEDRLGFNKQGFKSESAEWYESEPLIPLRHLRSRTMKSANKHHKELKITSSLHFVEINANGGYQKIVIRLFNSFAILGVFLATGIFFIAKHNMNNKPLDMELARKQIDSANLEFVRSFNNSDSVGIANMFTLDGKSMGPNVPSLNGRDEIRKHYHTVMSQGANKLTLQTTDLWGNADMLTEEGLFTFSDADGKKLDKGKYIVLWKQQEGKWKLFRDCYNSDLPIP